MAIEDSRQPSTLGYTMSSLFPLAVIRLARLHILSGMTVHRHWLPSWNRLLSLAGPKVGVKLRRRAFSSVKGTKIMTYGVTYYKKCYGHFLVHCVMEYRTAVGFGMVVVTPALKFQLHLHRSFMYPVYFLNNIAKTYSKKKYLPV